jgi:phosphoserine phosphatase
MDKVTTLYIVRHGQTEWNVEKRIQGHQDSPLTELGIKQAQWLGEALQNDHLDVIYSSPSTRAYKTAEYIRRHRQIDVIECAAFKEINVGVWEGQTFSSLEQKYPEQLKNFWENPAAFSVPDSETFADVQQRALRQLKHILVRHKGQAVLIATHTVVLKLLMAYFEDRPLAHLWHPPYVHPACLCKVDFNNDRPTIRLHADISHYQEDVKA